MLIGRLDGRGAIYRQLYRALRQAILEGRAPGGSRLPSTRWIALETGVSRNRVVMAYAQLLDEGYVTGRVGSGTYVAAELPAEGEAPHRAPARVPETGTRHRSSSPSRKRFERGAAWTASVQGPRYDFRYGRPSFDDFPRSVWARLVRRRAHLTAADLDYAPAAGHPELREAIAAHLARWRGVACTADQVIVVNGSQQALGLAASVLVDPGERVVIENPHYPGARNALEAARVTIHPVRVDEQGLDVARLADVRARLAYVTPAHQFPTGVILPLARRLSLLAWASRVGAYVIEDDYDSEYRYGGTPIESLHGLDRSGHVLYVGSFSKTLSPALRLGYLVVPRALVRAFTLAKVASDLGTAGFNQRVLADFITEGHLEVHLRRSRRRHTARREALLSAIDQRLGQAVHVVGGAAGLHVLVVLRGRTLREVPLIVHKALEHDVGVYSSAPFYMSRPHRAELVLGHGSLSADDIAHGITRLARVLQEVRTLPVAAPSR